ncbi:hypothetical protein [Kaistia granuli]|uniref:hypothetical protein n=1 Tax=Kaistia granuli TaxID=363259 RepID=UPI0003715888|nr:hypothetical protein [Kaistia granuli]
MDDKLHPLAIEHLPFFITAPGQTDVLFNVMVVFMLAAVLLVGNLYFQLHAFPERLAHRTNVVQMEIVAVLALISLFTHNHLFWIAGLLLALVRFPDFSTPMESIAGSLEKLAGQRGGGVDRSAMAPGPDASPDTLTSPASPDRPAVAPDPERGGQTTGKATAAHAPKQGH